MKLERSVWVLDLLVVGLLVLAVLVQSYRNHLVEEDRAHPKQGVNEYGVTINVGWEEFNARDARLAFVGKVAIFSAVPADLALVIVATRACARRPRSWTGWGSLVIGLAAGFLLALAMLAMMLPHGGMIG
jgi:hypothetical protein